MGSSGRGRGASEGAEGPAFFNEYIRPCFAEFCGTTIFVFVGTMSSQSGNVLPIALAHGLAIFLLVTVYGHIRYEQGYVTQHYLYYMISLKYEVFFLMNIFSARCELKIYI